MARLPGRGGLAVRRYQRRSGSRRAVGALTSTSGRLVVLEFELAEPSLLLVHAAASRIQRLAAPGLEVTPAQHQVPFRLIRQHSTTPVAVGEALTSIWNVLPRCIRATRISRPDHGGALRGSWREVAPSPGVEREGAGQGGILAGGAHKRAPRGVGSRAGRVTRG